MNDKIEQPAKTSLEYPPSGFPVFFADNAANAVWGQAIVKWYFTRSEPPMVTLGNTKIQPFAQVIMPTEGFIAMTVFFEKVVEALVRDKQITQERVDELRKVWDGHK